MEKHYNKVFLHLASPTIGNDVRRLVRELASLAGVAHVAPGSRVSDLLSIDYDQQFGRLAIDLHIPLNVVSIPAIEHF